MGLNLLGYQSQLLLQHCHPGCGHEVSSHLSRFSSTIFYRNASLALLQRVNHWLHFTYSRYRPFCYGSQNLKKKTDSVKNRTNDFSASGLRVYLYTTRAPGQLCLLTKEMKRTTANGFSFADGSSDLVEPFLFKPLSG